MRPFRLIPADAERYVAIRREMLLDAPWAFLGSPEDDFARDVKEVALRLGRDDNAIFGIEAESDEAAKRLSDEGMIAAAELRSPSPLPSPQGRGSEASSQMRPLVSVAGIFREPRSKTRHRAGLWGVYTTPTSRGKGLSRLVVGAAIRHALTWPGVDLITLCVSERATEARRLYESFGFVRWGTEPDAVRVGSESFTDHYMHLRLRPSGVMKDGAR